VNALEWARNGFLVAVVLALGGCSVAGLRGTSSYTVGGGSAIYAGSTVPAAKTKTGLKLYFGQHVVRRGGDGRGCCYTTSNISYSYGKPRGAVLALWSATEYGDERYYSQEFDRWLQKPVATRFYYAVAQESQIAPYPAKSAGHRSFGVYVSAGRVVVSGAALRPEDAQSAKPIMNDDGGYRHYVMGREDALYYKILSHGVDAPEVADDPSPWHAIQGVEISEEQHDELRRCELREGCRSFLVADDADLSPEQREYVRQNPIRRSDLKLLIERMERSRRQHNRWA